MARPKYLLQEIEGQQPHLYIWTPILAKKDGMRPISDREAKEYMKGSKSGLPNIKKPEDILRESLPEDEFLSEDEEDDTDSAILSELESDAPKTSTIDGKAKPLVVTQEDLLGKDMDKIRTLKKRASVEEYILKKYKIPMIPMDTLEEMFDQAREVLSTLADTQSLHD